jgi:hypothetical protein
MSLAQCHPEAIVDVEANHQLGNRKSSRWYGACCLPIHQPLSAPQLTLDAASCHRGQWQVDLTCLFSDKRYLTLRIAIRQDLVTWPRQTLNLDPRTWSINILSGLSRKPSLAIIIPGPLTSCDIFESGHPCEAIDSVHWPPTCAWIRAPHPGLSPPPQQTPSSRSLLCTIDL